MFNIKMSLVLAGLFVGGCSDKEGGTQAGSIDVVDPAPTCEEVPCADGYACVDVDGDLACENIDECTDGLDDCGDGYTCEDTEGSFTCNNINECADGSAECDEGFACTDTDGSYTCDNIDECAEGSAECDEGFACADTEGSYTCENVDECADGTYECDAGFACVDNEGSYTCENIDECADGTAEGVCPSGYACSDTEGSFTCANIDECAEGTGECDEGYACVDTEGSFTCDNVDECADGTDDCTDGYACTDTDGSFTCDNIDECADGTDDCTEGYACVDTDGSFTCDNIDECAGGAFECDDGYACADTDGAYECLNIDECAEGTDECTDGYSCADTDGSYECLNIDECAGDTPPCADGLTCADTDGSFTCDAVYSELGDQLGTLQIDPVAGTVTVTAQPDNFTLSVTDLTEPDPSGRTFELTVESGMDRLLFNLKAVIDSPIGVVEGTGRLWTEDHKGYVGFGRTSFLPGDSKTATMSAYFGEGDEVVDVDLRFLDAPMFMMGSYGYDSVDTSMADDNSYGDFDGGVRGRQRAISPDGRYVYMGEKNDLEVSVHDTSTGDFTTWSLYGDEHSFDGSVAGIAVSADSEHVYVLISEGAHYNGYYADEELVAVSLVELDALTMEETRRLDIHSWKVEEPCSDDSLDECVCPDDFYPTDDDLSCVKYGDPESRMARYLAWSPDGNVLAASLGAGNNDEHSSYNELWFIDVPTMTVIDTNPATPEVADPVVLPAEGYGEQMVWEGDYVIVGHNTKNSFDSYSVAQLSFVHSGTYDVITVTPPEGHGAKASTMSTSPGVVYYASREGGADEVFSAIEVATQTEIYTVRVGATLRYAMYEPRSGNIFVGGYEAWIFDAATGEPVDANGDPDDGISSIEHSSARAHSNIMTPF